MANELLEEIRHQCRNGLVSIQHGLNQIAQAENMMRRALISMADETARIEKAINFLDRLEKENDK